MVITTGPPAGSTNNCFGLTAEHEIQAKPRARPALQVTRTLLTEWSHRPIGYCAVFTKPPGFANAVVQRMAGGDTRLFNQAARRLLAQAQVGISPIAQGWWAHQVTRGCDGAVHCDPTGPACTSEQHGGNQIGANLHPMVRLLRQRLLMEARFGG